MTDQLRHSTGIDGLDELLGGGLIPGTLTVVVGATGIGKTQLGVQFAAAGRDQEGQPGVFFDMSARGDSQSHQEYAQRIAGWQLESLPASQLTAARSYQLEQSCGDYLHIFEQQGRRVTRRDLDWDEWHAWQAQLNAKLTTTIAFLYGNLVRGRRRIVIDGIEPVERANESVQLNMFEYIYHQVVRKDPEWVARDLFRQDFHQQASAAAQHRYQVAEVSCLLLYTAHETMLEEMIARPLGEGDALANANTLIYMGKVKQGDRIGRSLYIAKHRGSECSDQLIPFQIDEQGLKLSPGSD